MASKPKGKATPKKRTVKEPTGATNKRGRPPKGGIVRSTNAWAAEFATSVGAEDPELARNIALRVVRERYSRAFESIPQTSESAATLVLHRLVDAARMMELLVSLRGDRWRPLTVAQLQAADGQLEDLEGVLEKLVRASENLEAVTRSFRLLVDSALVDVLADLLKKDREMRGKLRPELAEFLAKSLGVSSDEAKKTLDRAIRENWGTKNPKGPRAAALEIVAVLLGVPTSTLRDARYGPARVLLPRLEAVHTRYLTEPRGLASFSSSEARYVFGDVTIGPFVVQRKEPTPPREGLLEALRAGMPTKPRKK